MSIGQLYSAQTNCKLFLTGEIKKKFQILYDNEKAANEESQKSYGAKKCCDESVKLFTASASAMLTVWNKCQAYSRSVEICYHDEEGSEILTKVYFSHEQVSVNKIELFLSLCQISHRYTDKLTHCSFIMYFL